MHPLTQGVTVVVTPCARFYGAGLRRGVPLAQLVDEAARREARRARAGEPAEAPPGAATEQGAH